MNFKILSLNFSLSLFLTGIQAQAADYVFEPQQSEVTFLAKAKPAWITIEGRGKGVSGELKEKDGLYSGELQFDLTTLDTANETRNEHMKDKYLEVQKFPTAILHIKDLKIPKDQKTFDFSGEMEIKGERKPISGKTTLLEEKNGLQKIKSDFSIKLSDYPKIGVPAYRGLTVAEDVSLTVSATAKRN